MPRLLLIVLSLTALLGCTSPPTQIAPAPPGALRIASHNVHYIALREATGAWSVGDWDDRKQSLDLAFKSLDADIVAFQEMESFGRGDTDGINLARDWLLAQNPGYAAGANGDAAVFPSTQPIFYRTDRLELLEQGWFFFSDTPDVIYSRTFDGSYPAFTSWARLQDRTTDRVVTVVNVHMEYKSGSNRLKSAALTVERMAPWLARGEALILAGDLNALQGSKTAQVFRDAGFAFVDVPGATYHFNRGIDLFGAIDHIATAGPAFAVGPAQVQRGRFDGRFPSDHYPVLADVILN